MASPIYVTRPSLAPLSEFEAYLREVWRSGVMTHNGPLVQRLERELCDYLGVRNLVCLANGTCALQLAIRALDLEGEIITTPFTYVATANIISWERCVPVFADIDPHTWNIDPDDVESLVTERTSAILPVHVFSAPCDDARLQAIADRHGLKLIYDAAHATAVEVDGASVLRRGDVSALSFHATKLFNTGEGGACVTDDDALAERIRRMRFFGHDDAKEIVDEGMNAKMTEINAALGLANLAHLDAVRAARREKTACYEQRLGDVPFVTFQHHDRDAYNYSYLPIVLDTEARLLALVERLAAAGIHPRRYFHPALNTVAHFAATRPLPVAERVAASVLCLPLYDTLEEADIDRICAHVRAG